MFSRLFFCSERMCIEMPSEKEFKPEKFHCEKEASLYSRELFTTFLSKQKLPYITRPSVISVPAQYSTLYRLSQSPSNPPQHGTSPPPTPRLYHNNPGLDIPYFDISKSSDSSPSPVCDTVLSAVRREASVLRFAFTISEMDSLPSIEQMLVREGEHELPW